VECAWALVWALGNMPALDMMDLALLKSNGLLVTFSYGCHQLQKEAGYMVRACYLTQPAQPPLVEFSASTFLGMQHHSITRFVSFVEIFLENIKYLDIHLAV
jgi:hypothetical protein